MPVYKSKPQYAIYCDYCDNLTDFSEFENKKAAFEYWRGIGWRRSSENKCVCPDCVKKIDEISERLSKAFDKTVEKLMTKYG